MRSTFTLLAVLLFAPLSASCAGGLAIAEDGQARAVVVLAEDVRAKDLAVRALVSHVKQISGATLPVRPEAEFAAVRIEGGRLVAPEGGGAAQTLILLGDGALSRRMGFTLDGVGAGGVVVQTRGNALALLAKDDGSSGRTPAGARPVFRFLEELGCRCLWPGETGKVVPRRRTLVAGDLDVRFTPPIGQRHIRFSEADARNSAQGLAWIGYTPDDYRAALAAASRTESEGSWAAWNGLGGNLGIVGGAAGCGLRGGWDEHGAKHPEWFALQADGTRDQSRAKERWRLCVSHTGLVAHVAGDIIARLNGRAQPAVSLCPNDGGYSSFCQCDACAKLDAPDGPKIRMLVFRKVGESARDEVGHVSLTDRYVHFWNAVAERVTRVVPDQLFLVEAYSIYSDPPVREELHPNLVVRYVPTDPDGWAGWRAAGAKRLYWRPNNLHAVHRHGLPGPRARIDAGTLRHLADHGMLATDMDSIYHHWATQGLHYYAMARLSWDPSQPFDALLDDYCRTGFGAGAEDVKVYFLRAEKAIVPAGMGRHAEFPPLARDAIVALRASLDAAARATEADAPANRRVAFLRAGLEFTALSADVHAGARPPEHLRNMMRALFQQQPLAVNAGVVAGAERGWLHEDQSATRKP